MGKSDSEISKPSKGLKEFKGDITKRVDTLSDDLREFKGDIIGRMDTLSNTVNTLSGDLKEFKSATNKRFDTLAMEIHKQGVLAEKRDDKIDQIYELVHGQIERNMPDNEIRATFKNHDGRIRNLEIHTKN